MSIIEQTLDSPSGKLFLSTESPFHIGIILDSNGDVSHIISRRDETIKLQQNEQPMSLEVEGKPLLCFAEPIDPYIHKTDLPVNLTQFLKLWNNIGDIEVVSARDMLDELHFDLITQNKQSSVAQQYTEAQQKQLFENETRLPDELREHLNTYLDKKRRGNVNPIDKKSNGTAPERH